MTRRLSIFCSLLLLALWFPAAQHCALEIAGFFPDTCPQECSHLTDNCGTVESLVFQPAVAVVKVPTLALIAAQPCAAFALPDPSVVISLLPGAPPTRAPDWVAPWTFVRRAAPSPRAPSLA